MVRERFFTPRLRVASYEELNAWLLNRCVAYAKAHKHPELTDCTIWQAFEAERPQLVQITGPFDGFHATQASVTKTTQHTLMVAVARGEMPYGQFVQEDTLIGIRTAAGIRPLLRKLE